MTNEAIDKLLESCDELQRRTIWKEGCMHNGARCFDACMRVFDCETPANWIEFDVFFNAPMMLAGRARIYSDGHMEMRLG